jgi:hypothetical protein
MRNVPLDTLASFSHRFDLFDSGPEYDSSLLSTGLHPPLPVHENDLIWGFGIAGDAEKAGMSELPIVEVSHGGRLLLAVKLENRTGSFTLKEQLAIHTLALELGENEDFDAISLAVSGNHGFFSRMERFNKLPSFLADRVIEGRLDLSVAEKVVLVPKEACVLAFGNQHFTFSQLRGFLTYIAEIQRRDNLSVPEVLDLASVALKEKDPTAAVRRIRNPQMTLLTERFDAVKKQYTHHTGVDLKAPPYFEGDAYTVSFSFRNTTELQRKMRVIEKLEDGCGELEDLL